MANLVDIAPPLGMDLATDELVLAAPSTVAAVEGGVYNIDPTSGLVDANGTYKYTRTIVVDGNEMRGGMFVVSRGAVTAAYQGVFQGHFQGLVRMSAEAGTIVPGDLLIASPGKNYLIRGTAADLVSRRAVGRAVKTVSSATPILEQCYFSGLAPFFGGADASPGVIDEPMTTMWDRGIMLGAALDFSGGDYTIAEALLSGTMPSVRIARPRLQAGNLIKWDAIGFWSSADAVAETYTFTLNVNGVDTGALLVFAPAGAASGAVNVCTFTAEARTIESTGAVGGQVQTFFSGVLTRYNFQNSLIVDQTKASCLTVVHPAAGSINATIDNVCAWKFAHTVGTNHYLSWKGVICYMDAWLTGA